MPTTMHDVSISAKRLFDGVVGEVSCLEVPVKWDADSALLAAGVATLAAIVAILTLSRRNRTLLSFSLIAAAICAPIGSSVYYMAVDKQYHCKLYIKVEGVIEVINVISDDPVEPGKRVEVMEYIDGSHRLLENEAL